MKRVLVILFSLLLIFLMVPVLPDAAYADDGPMIDEELLKSISLEQNIYVPEGLVKIPGATGTVTSGAKASPESITTTCFHDSTLPNNGWIAIDSDGDGYNWMYAKDFYEGFYSLDGADGECVTSASYRNDVGPLNPDNWLISPAITVSSNTQFNYFIAGQDPSYCSEYYGVFISTTSQTDLSSFHKVHSETVNTGGETYTGRFVDLRPYAGQTIYIAFRHYNCTDMYWLNLDGLSIAPYTGSYPVVPPKIIRVKGQDRYQTSIQVALKLLEEANGAYYNNVIIATGDNFPDALAGSSLSTKYNLPIILVSAKKPSSIDDAISFIHDYVSSSGSVFILGGLGAVPSSVEERLAAIGYTDEGNPGHVMRLNGKDRYETNLMVLEMLDYYDPISWLLVCDGTNWPDAATASATAYPIMLMPKAGPTEQQDTALGIIKSNAQDGGYDFEIGVVGGSGAVSDDVFNMMSAYDTDNGAGRLAGSNRAETAVLVAGTLFSTPPTRVTIAYGANYPDTISGGILAHYMNAPILYGDSKVPTPYLKAAKPYVQYYQIHTAYVLGGESLVSDQFVIDLLTY